MLLRRRVEGLINTLYETRNALWSPDLIVPKTDNVIIHKSGVSGIEEFLAANLITTAGDKYYAQGGVVEVQTDAFAELTLSTNPWAPVPNKATTSDDLVSAVANGSGLKTVKAGYPKTADVDPANSGSGPAVMTWLFEFAAGDFDDPSVEGMGIHVAGAVFGAATADPMLTSFNATAFALTPTDSLRVFVNHSLLGVP